MLQQSDQCLTILNFRLLVGEVQQKPQLKGRIGIGQAVALFSCGLLGTQKYLIGIIVTVKDTPDRIAFIGIVRIIAHGSFGFLHKPVSRLILGRNRDDVDVAAPTTETLEIPDLGFTAFADKVYDRIPLSASGRPAADFLYSTHVAFPPMNGIAPYRPCRYPLAMFSPFRGEKSVKA